MSVLALVTKPEEVGPVVPWASKFAASRDAALNIVCWSYSPTTQYPLLSEDGVTIENDELVAAVRSTLAEQEQSKVPADRIHIRRALHPDATNATLDRIRKYDADLVVVAAADQSGKTGATYATNPLLRQSPCTTVILFGGPDRTSKDDLVLVANTDTPHDKAALASAALVAATFKSKVSLVRLEEDSGEDATEVGRRELRQLLKDADVKRSERIRTRVYLPDESRRIATAAENHDLVLIGANNPKIVQDFVEMTNTPTIGVIKRSPPLRLWRRGPKGTRWIPRLTAGDYADLVQGLRRGSRLDADFLIMLGLAAAIASLGLLQDSPAVVIGSMLLAPLMTPMITSGLALAQANQKLGTSSIRTIIVGFMLTLAVSLVVATVMPGEEMTAQVVARGDPNLLDLFIALFSAAAAAYALARPSIAAAVAGVAIATALVPPLCSVGISIAYREFTNAEGAALLFVTNLVAIVLAAAATFRLMGVTAARASATQRRWVFRTAAAFLAAVLVLAYPLERALERNIQQGKPQPNMFPLTKVVEEALIETVEQTPKVQLIASGRPSSLHDKADVILVLTSPHPLPESYADRLIEVVRKEMADTELAVEVHCLQAAWQKSSR